MQKSYYYPVSAAPAEVAPFPAEDKKSGPTAICCGQAANLILLELSAVELDDLTIVNFHRDFFSFR